MADLFTRAEFKSYVGMAHGTTTHDLALDMYVRMISRAVDKLLGRVVVSAAHTEVHDGTGRNTVIIQNPPITVLTTVFISGAQTWDSTTTVAADRYTFEAEAGLVILTESGLNPDLFPLDAAVFNKGVLNVRIDYTGGWTTATLPEDLKMGAMIWCASLFNRRTLAGIVARTAGGMSVTMSSKHIPDEARPLLLAYRRPPRKRHVTAP